MSIPEQVLHFWFERTPASAWFRTGAEGDRAVRDRFGELTEQAQALTLRALEAGWVDAEPAPERRPFWLMPLMHSEDLALQALGLPLFERHTDARTAEFARCHLDVIVRFGRFPHRHRALGRPSSREELTFLQQPGSRF